MVKEQIWVLLFLKCSKKNKALKKRTLKSIGELVYLQVNHFVIGIGYSHHYCLTHGGVGEEKFKSDPSRLLGWPTLRLLSHFWTSCCISWNRLTITPVFCNPKQLMYLNIHNTCSFLTPFSSLFFIRGNKVPYYLISIKILVQFSQIIFNK